MAEEASTQATEATPQSTAPTEGQSTEAPQTWSYGEGVSGTGDKPEWFNDSKYKSVAEQAKAQRELEGKLGGFTGSPEEYSFNEGVEADAEMFAGLQEIGKKYGMNNDMYNDIVNMYNEQENAAIEANRTREIEGLGDNGQQRIDNVNDWLTANVSSDEKEVLGELVQTAEQLGVIEKMISLSKGQPLADASVTSTSKTYTQDEYDSMFAAKDDYGRRRVSTDPAYRKQLQEYARNIK